MKDFEEIHFTACVDAGETTEERQQLAMLEDSDDEHQRAQSGPARRRRRRRSTLGWLQSALRMCDMGFTSVDRRCRRIEVADHHMRIRIILRDQ